MCVCVCACYTHNDTRCPNDNFSVSAYENPLENRKLLWSVRKLNFTCILFAINLEKPDVFLFNPV